MAAGKHAADGDGVDVVMSSDEGSSQQQTGLPLVLPASTDTNDKGFLEASSAEAAVAYDKMPNAAPEAEPLPAELKPVTDGGDAPKQTEEPATADAPMEAATADAEADDLFPAVQASQPAAGGECVETQPDRAAMAAAKKAIKEEAVAEKAAAAKAKADAKVEAKAATAAAKAQAKADAAASGNGKKRGRPKSQAKTPEVSAGGKKLKTDA